MPPLIIDAQEIILAVENHDPLQRHYLDRESGEVVSLHEDYSTEDEWEPLDIDPDRYLRIEPLASSDSYAVMRGFVETLPQGRVQAELMLALDSRKPFRRFKEMLLKYPAVREAWFDFHEQAGVVLVQDWLKAYQIDAVVRRLTPAEIEARFRPRQAPDK